jgi:uncharacterized protein (TIGR02996 family)
VSTREDLEAALRTRPDDATLGVYADFLQAQGDPRGELIALDLRAPAMSIQSIEVRRGQLLRAWLGDDVEVAFDGDQQLWYAGDLDGSYATFDCGFIDLVIVGEVPALIGTPATAYVRRVSTVGSGEAIVPVIAWLAAAPRPWLSHLCIERSSGSTLLVGNNLGEQLAASTPNLEVLDLAGRNLFDRFAHPNVRELGLVGSEAIDLVVGPPFRALRSIDYRFDGDRPVPRGLFAPARLPALRQLEFSREEPGGERLFPMLGLLDVAPQLARLVLPSIRSYRDHALVQAAIDRMPVLRELAFARAYEVHGWFDELRHASAHVTLPIPFPWQPREMLVEYTLSVDGVAVDLVELVEVLEVAYPEQPEHLQAAWHRFWRGRSMSARELADALAPLPLAGMLALLREHLVTEVAKRGEYFAELDWRT